LRFSRKRDNGSAPNFFQGLGKNTFSLQPALKNTAPAFNFAFILLLSLLALVMTKTITCYLLVYLSRYRRHIYKPGQTQCIRNE